MQSCGPVACTYMLQLLSGGELANPELSREIILHHLVQMIQKIGIYDKIEYGKIESEEQHKQWLIEYKLKMEYAYGLYKQPFNFFIEEITSEKKCIQCGIVDFQQTHMASFLCRCSFHLQCIKKIASQGKCICNQQISENCYIIENWNGPVELFPISRMVTDWNQVIM